jgi:hypothetical protein
MPTAATVATRIPDLPRSFSAKKTWILSEKLGWKNWHIRTVNRPILKNRPILS